MVFGLLAVGCGELADDAAMDEASCAEAKCDDVSEQEPACASSFIDVSGASTSLTDLGDPLARHALIAGDRCPRDFGEALVKLRHADPQKCTPAIISVSETATFVEDPSKQPYRAVMQACEGKFAIGFGATATVLASFSGVRPAALPLDDFRLVELIGIDEDQGVSNFYSIDANGTWRYHGNSIDYAEQFAFAGIHEALAE